MTKHDIFHLYEWPPIPDIDCLLKQKLPGYRISPASFDIQYPALEWSDKILITVGYAHRTCQPASVMPLLLILLYDISLPGQNQNFPHLYEEMAVL